MAGEVFISYRRADQAWARLLHAQLQAEGVEAWYDAQVGAGQDWRIATAKALEDSKIFVLLFSENAAQSSDIAKELAAAVLEKKLIIPVRLENIAPKGAFLYELASRNWVNAYDNTEAKLAELAKGLAHLVRTGARDESVLPFDRTSDTKPTSRPPKWHSRTVLIAAAAVAVIAASAAAWLLWPAPHWTVEGSRPFISTLALEGMPAFSPDGKMLAYASGPDVTSNKIYVRNLAGGDGIRITSDAYNDTSPSWSSDGAHIAYSADKPGEPCRIMIATVPAGETREVGRCRKAQSSSVAWKPNSSFLYFTDEGDGDDSTGRIFRLDLDTGERLKITGHGPIAPLSDLRISPDGKSLAHLAYGYSSILLTVSDLTSGKERILGRVHMTSSGAWVNSDAWSADSKILFVSESSGSGSEIIAFPVDGHAPYRIYESATGISHLSASVGGLLAIESHISRKNLARASPTPITQPDIIDPASGVTFSPTFAPDGTLAFLSDRSGSNTIWIKKPGAAPVPLFDGGSASLGRQNFSPDGRLLAAMIANPNGMTIKILTADGASVASFDMPDVGSGLPTWTPDGKGLIVWDSRIRRAVRADVAEPARRSPVAPPDWQGVTIRSNGTFATRDDKAGVWRIDNGIRLLSGKYPADWGPPIAFLGDDVLIPDFNATGGPRILAQPLAGGPDRVLAYAPGAAGLHYQSKMVVNPKTGEVIYVASVSSDTNIDLLTLAKR